MDIESKSVGNSGGDQAGANAGVPHACARAEQPKNGGHGLPCLNCQISIQDQEPGRDQEKPEHRILSANNKRSAFVLRESIAQLSNNYGLQKLGFLTLTFAEHILDPTEAQKRLNSLFSNVIKPRYGEYVGVFERQKSGRIHYHLLVVLSFDLKTGVNFDEFAKNNYRSASPQLRSEWAFWRKTAKAYGFGRTELMPVKNNTEAISRYVGKYIAKHIESRPSSDKGVRLVRYSRGARAGTCNFMFLSKGSMSWRESVGIFAEILSRELNRPISGLDDIKSVLGPRWAYHCRPYLRDIQSCVESVHKSGVSSISCDWRKLFSDFQIKPYLQTKGYRL